MKQISLKRNEYHKEGQVQGAVGTIIMLIVGVGVAVLVLIFVGILGGQAYQTSEDNLAEVGNNSQTADTFIAIQGQAANLVHDDIHVNTLRIYNSTSPNVEWHLNNFSINYNTGAVNLINGTGTEDAGHPLNNTVLEANYSYGDIEIQDSIRNSISSGFEALEDTGNYLPLIVLGIVIFIVLSLVLGITALTGGGFKGSAL